MSTGQGELAADGTAPSYHTVSKGDAIFAWFVPGIAS